LRATKLFERGIDLKKRIILALLAGLLVIMAAPAYVLAQTSDRLIEVTYADAIRQSLLRNATMTPLNRQIRDIDVEIRETTRTRLEIINADRPRAEAMYGDYLRLKIERDRLQLEADRFRLSVELSLRESLSSIASSEANLVLLEATLAFQEETLRQAHLRLYHGVATEMDVRAAEQDIEQTLISMERLELVLENERLEINRLINRPITSNVRIIYDISDTLPPLPDESEMERFIQRQIYESPNFRIYYYVAAMQRYEWQRQIEDPMVDNTVMRLQFDLAVMDRNEARRQAELAIVNALTEWERLIEHERFLQAELEQAIANHQLMQSRFEAGLVTQIQVDALALVIMQHEVGIALHDYELWKARIRIDHPYMI